MTQQEHTVRIRTTTEGDITVSGSDIRETASTVSAINQAISSLPHSGGKLEFSAGIFEISEPIVVDRPLSMTGIAPGNTTDVQNMSLLVATPDIDGPVIDVTGHHSSEGFMHGTYIGNLGIVGTDDPETKRDCLRFSRPEDVRLTKTSLHRLIIDSAGRHGVHFETSDHHCTVNNVWSGHHHGDAFALCSGSRYWLTNCYGYDSRNGFRISDTVEDVSIITPHSRRNDAAGLLVEGGPTQILGGRFVNNDGSGVAVSGTNHVTLAHAEIFNNTEFGVEVGCRDRPTANTALFGNRLGNRGEETEVEVTPDNLPSRLRDLGIRGSVQKLRRYGISNVASGYLPGGSIDKSQHRGVVIGPHARDTRISDTVFTNQSGSWIRNDGMRTVMNGVGYNDGPPTQGGQWQNNGRPGLWIVDTEANTLYTWIQDGWIQLVTGEPS